MKKISLVLSFLLLIIGLSSSAFATPIIGTYSTLATLKSGVWQEDFPSGMGAPDSILTAFSAGTPLQWSLSMTGLGANPYDGTLEPIPPPATRQPSWDWQTLYEGTITIGGSLTKTGDPITFDAKGVNYNVTYGKYQDLLKRNLLEFRFYGSGAYIDADTGDVYLIDFSAYYYGAPKLNETSIGDTLKTLQVSISQAPQAAPVPEPATMFLLGSGLIGVGVFVRKKFKK
ncbi:MAG: PEP-CTERM sorting domain-containing protein [Thermodesulfobacteriota bacterium]